MTAVIEKVTGIYDSEDKVRNVRLDLIATGIPQEKIYVDRDKHQVKVVIPTTTKAEIVEILNRHAPTLVV